MNYDIIDYISRLPIKDYSEKELSIRAKKNNQTIFDMYIFSQKEILTIHMYYYINIDTNEKWVSGKKELLDENVFYFNKYQDFLNFLSKM